MFLKKNFFSAVAFITVLCGSAQAEVYECSLSDPGRHGVIPKKLVVDVRTPTEALVYDPFSHHMKQTPNKADFLMNNEKLLRVRWVVEDMVFDGGGVRDMKFSLVYQKKKKDKAHLTLNITGADNTDSGNGHCKLRS